MTRVVCISFLVFMVMGCGNEAGQKPLSNDLAQLENDWMHAVMKRDKALLDRLVAPEFTVTGMGYMDSAAVTRTVWMNNVMQDLAIDSVQFIKTKVNTVDDVGIVKAQFYWSGTYGGDRFADTSYFVDTWIQRNGEWRVVSRIMTGEARQ